MIDSIVPRGLPQASSPGLPLYGQVGDHLNGGWLELKFKAVDLEHPLILLHKGILGLGEN